LQIQNLKTQNHFYSQFKKSENKEYNLFIIKTSENKEYFLFTIKNVKTYFFKTEILLQKLKRTTIYKVWIPCPNSKSRNMIFFFNSNKQRYICKLKHIQNLNPQKCSKGFYL
jgi:hypothetical protein